MKVLSSNLIQYIYFPKDFIKTKQDQNRTPKQKQKKMQNRKKSKTPNHMWTVCNCGKITSA